MDDDEAHARRFPWLLGRHWASVALIAIVLAIAMGFVVRDGGTPSAYAHFMYAPTILAAYRYRGIGGAACGLVGGILVGPGAAWVVTGSPVTDPSWIVRAAWIAVVGFTLGALFHHARHQAGLLDKHLHVDAATGLPNVSGMHRLVMKHFQSGRDSAGEIRATAIKIVNYDALVGSFGYRTVDSVMHALGEQVAESLPDGALLGRAAPDDLIVLDSPGDTPAGDSTSDLLRARILPTLEVGRMQVYVDIVFGSAEASLPVSSLDELFVQASAAAGRARDRGKRAGVYDQVEESRRRKALQLLADVPRALRQNEMHLLYQPKLDLRTHEVVGAEALIRWQHPGRGAVAPDQFIPIVEDTALIEDLTRWVLENAIRQACVWDARAAPQVAVNISSRNLMNDVLLQHVDTLLEEHGLAPGRLELEVTETALTDIDAAHLDLLWGLREKGVRIAIDDFGTGYASLAYIRRLPVDTLKLDRSFIASAPSQPKDRQMLRRIVQIASDLDLEVVGEGVEDRETLDLLAHLGCDQAQGFYISRPLPATEMAEVVREGKRLDYGIGGS